MPNSRERVRVLHDCHVVICVMIAIAIVGLRSGCSCCCSGVPVALRLKDVLADEGRVNIAVDDKGLLSKTSNHKLDYNCNQSNS